MIVAAIVALIASEAGGRSRPIMSMGDVIVQPPAGWKILQHNRRNILLVRPDIPFHGPIQPEGQARINFGPTATAPPGLEADLKDYARDGVVTLRRRLELRGSGSPCRDLVEQVVDVDPYLSGDPKALKIVYTDVFCRTGSAVYVGVLSAWQDRRHRNRDRGALLDMMQSLRLAPKPSQDVSGRRRSS